MKRKIHGVLYNCKKFIKERPKLKMIVGVALIVVGFVALVTPLTPGSWLAIIGLELLGLRIVLRDWVLKQKEIYISHKK
ncbi:MAG: hypothetical protein WC819_02870 [Parcubacteria group bacterium]|jgi:uncharacterized protein YqgC (DUF456 family)